MSILTLALKLGVAIAVLGTLIALAAWLVGVSALLLEDWRWRRAEHEARMRLRARYAQEGETWRFGVRGR